MAATAAVTYPGTAGAQDQAADPVGHIGDRYVPKPAGTVERLQLGEQASSPHQN